MSTKHNTIVNDSPLSREYFDDVLDMFYDNNEKNEEFYNELHETYKNNQPSGFSLGTSKTTVDLTRNLAELRSNAISGVSALFNAKKAIAELELKKKAQDIDKDKVNNDKEYIRNILNEINNTKEKPLISRRLANAEGRQIVTSVEDVKRVLDQEKIEKQINEKINSGEIAFTQNEKAMKYDFNNQSEVVFDSNSGTVKAVKKGTSEILKDYPIERGQVGEITRLDVEEGFAYADNGKKIRIASVKE